MKRFKWATLGIFFLIFWFSASLPADVGGSLNPTKNNPLANRHDVVDTTSPTKLFDQYRESRYSMRWFDKHKERIQEAYRRIDKIEEGFQALGRDKEAQKMRDMKRQFALIKRQMPQRQGFLQTIVNMMKYKSQLLKPHARKLIKLASDIEEYDKKLKEEQKKQGIKAAAAGAAQDAVVSEPVKTPLEIYVAELSGDMKFFVNGEEVHAIGYRFPLPASKKIKLQALLMGKQRKYGLGLKRKGNIIEIDRTNHFLNYKVQLPGGGIGETSWEIDDERYTWRVRPSKTDGKWEIDNGEHLNVEDDVLVLYGPRAMSYSIDVSGKAKWKTTYKTHGNPLTRLDEGTGHIKIAIAPQ
ncbi:hypothetical protein [Methylomarinum vadi]|uniref:hypothetical protein n=1 Tax=Methylomarinum vadi TaxID=438855 RepID=UPI0004DEF0DB|nr:hypothetical protein [Methylomarinum vadi]